MQHREYGKIESSGRSTGGTVGGRWIAQEKIHGAQLQISVCGSDLRFGKRKAWLGESDPFFGWQLVRDGLAARARRAAASLDAHHVVLYGELFGGGYPHPDVAPVPGLRPVQTGVWYSPELRWAPFDVLVITGDHDDGEFLSPSELVALAEAVALDVPPVLTTGPRTTVEATPTAFPTRVPASLGLPSIEGNRAEGVVIRADRRERASERTTAKRKIAEFDEGRFQQATAWDPGQRLDAAELCGWADRLVNEPRVASATSKWGWHDVAAVLDEIEIDVLIDLADAFPGSDPLSDPTVEAVVRAHIRTTAEAFLPDEGRAT